MPNEKRFFNSERVLFFVLIALGGFFAWRIAIVKPLPDLPGEPEQRGIRMAQGEDPPLKRLASVPVPDFGAPAVRNPFDSAVESVKVIYAYVASSVRVNRSDAGASGRTASDASAEVRIEYRILPKPVSKFAVLIPPGVKLTRVDGSGVVDRINPEGKDLGRDGTLYDVRLRWPVDKKYVLTLFLAWSRKSDTAPMSVPEVILPDATHERGVIGIRAGLGVQLVLRSAQNVTPISLNKLPPELPERFYSAAFQYSTHPYSIEFDVKKPTVAVTTTVVVPPVDPNRVKIDTGTKTGSTPTLLKAFQVPVTFKGTLTIGTRRCVLLGDKVGENIARKFEGDSVFGMTVVEVRPTSIILKNDKGDLFEFRDPLREQNEY